MLFVIRLVTVKLSQKVKTGGLEIAVFCSISDLNKTTCTRQAVRVLNTRLLWYNDIHFSLSVPVYRIGKMIPQYTVYRYTVTPLIFEVHFMRPVVSVLVILSPTRTNKKYLWNCVAYSFWHHYQTNFMKTKFLLPLFWNRLWALIANACLPRVQVWKIWGCIMKLYH